MPLRSLNMTGWRVVCRRQHARDALTCRYKIARPDLADKISRYASKYYSAMLQGNSTQADCHGLDQSLADVVARQPRQLLRAGFADEVQDVVERHAHHVVDAARVAASRRRTAHWHRRAASHLKEEAVRDTASEAKKCQWGRACESAETNKADWAAE